jgi:hypothetical protein
MNKLLKKDEDKLPYYPIPFAEYITRRPIRTFINTNSRIPDLIPEVILEVIPEVIPELIPELIPMIIPLTKDDIEIKIQTKPKVTYSFTEDELTMSTTHFHNYVKSWNTDKIKELSSARRRYKNCIYSKKARLKRKTESNSKHSI